MDGQERYERFVGFCVINISLTPKTKNSRQCSEENTFESE